MSNLALELKNNSGVKVWGTSVEESMDSKMKKHRDFMGSPGIQIHILLSPALSATKVADTNKELLSNPVWFHAPSGAYPQQLAFELSYRSS